MEFVKGSEQLEQFAHALSALEHRVAALEAVHVQHGPGREPKPELTNSAELDLWLVREIDHRRPVNASPDGSVAFGGVAHNLGHSGGEVVYQWHRDNQDLIDDTWDGAITRLAAIAHPARGAIMRRLLVGSASVAQLIDEHILRSPGTSYHHLNTLVAAGWVEKNDTGEYSVRAARVIPLLTIIAAADNH